MTHPIHTVGDVCEFVVDGTHGSPIRTEFGIPVLSAQHVVNGNLNYETDRYTTVEEYENYSRRFQLARGDVLLTIVGTIGRSAVVEEVRPLVFQRSVAILRPKTEKIHSKYLYHLTQSKYFKSQLDKYTNKSAQAGIYLGKLKDISFPLPPLKEQQRVAALLDSSHNLVRLRGQSIKKLDELARSVFIEMFGDPFSKKTETIKLGEVATINMGQSPAGSTYNSTGDGVYLLNGPTEFGEKYPVPLQCTTSPTKMCNVGDVLFCVRGATAGKINISDGIYCIGRGLAAISSRNSDFANNEFIYILLKQYYSYFQSTGVGSTFINISKDDLLNLPIPKVKKDSLINFQKFEIENNKQKSLLERQKFDINRIVSSIQFSSFSEV